MAQQGFDVQGLMDAWASRDVNAIMRFYGDDVTLQHVGLKVEGKQAVREMVQTFADVLGEVRIEPKLVAQSEGAVAALVEVKGTYKADYRMPDGSVLPLKGKAFKLDLADFGELDEQGRIKREVQLHDNLGALLQLGLPQETLMRFVAQASPALP